MKYIIIIIIIIIILFYSLLVSADLNTRSKHFTNAVCSANWCDLL